MSECCYCKGEARDFLSDHFDTALKICCYECFYKIPPEVKKANATKAIYEERINASTGHPRKVCVGKEILSTGEKIYFR